MMIERELQWGSGCCETLSPAGGDWSTSFMYGVKQSEQTVYFTTLRSCLVCTWQGLWFILPYTTWCMKMHKGQYNIYTNWCPKKCRNLNACEHVGMCVVWLCSSLYCYNVNYSPVKRVSIGPYGQASFVPLNRNSFLSPPASRFWCHLYAYMYYWYRPSCLHVLLSYNQFREIHS